MLHLLTFAARESMISSLISQQCRLFTTSVLPSSRSSLRVDLSPLSLCGHVCTCYFYISLKAFFFSFLFFLNAVSVRRPQQGMCWLTGSVFLLTNIKTHSRVLFPYSAFRNLLTSSSLLVKSILSDLES